MVRVRGLVSAVCCVLSVLVMASCGAAEGEFEDFDKADRTRDGKVFGGLEGLFGGGDKKGAASGGTGIGVNSYLWRAALDTLSFMPIDQADPFGGVVLTDWYSPPEAEDERFKVNLYILGRQLRGDGLRVAVFQQERGPQGSWRDVEVNGETASELENAILARAREMRIASTQ